MKRGRKSNSGATDATTTTASSADPPPTLTEATTLSTSNSASSNSSSNSNSRLLTPHESTPSDCNLYHPPLIGPEYQVEVGEFIPPPTKDPALCTTTRHIRPTQPPLPLLSSSTDSPDCPAAAAAASSSSTSIVDDSSSQPITINAYFAQTCEWNPHLKSLLTDRRKSEALDKYVANCENLFYKDGRHVTQDIALHFLHQCEYDMPLANRLLKPWAAPVDEEDDFNEEEMYPADPFCAVCRDGGNLMLCDVCDKSYHAACVQLESVPAGSWTCPYHLCATCFGGVDRNLPSLSCSMCPTSYCSKHIPPDLRLRADAIGCQEVMCENCLKCEEQYEFIQRNKGSSENSCRRAFLHRLQMVLKREGRQLIRLPIIGGRELDLYQLYTHVCRGGGIYAILDSVGWREVRRAMRLPPTVHHQSALLKKFYVQILYPYEKQFYPFFRQLPLKKALAEKEDEEEEEELALLAAQAAAAAGKKKGKNQQLDDYQPAPRTVDPNVKDDTKPDDVLVSLKVGTPGGHTSMSKQKEKNAAKNKKKLKEKEKEKKKGTKHGRDKKLNNTDKKRLPKRGRPSQAAASNVPLSTSAAAALAGVTAPMKEHPAINIWTPTWWLHQANLSGNVLKHATTSSAQPAAATGTPATINQTDVQQALAAAMAVSSGSPNLTSSIPPSSPALNGLPPMEIGRSAIATHSTLTTTLLVAANGAHHHHHPNDPSNSKRKYQEILLAAQAQSAAASSSASASSTVYLLPVTNSPPFQSAPIPTTIATPPAPVPHPPEKRGRGRPAKHHPPVVTHSPPTNGHAPPTTVPSPLYSAMPTPATLDQPVAAPLPITNLDENAAQPNKKRKTSNGTLPPEVQQPQL